MDIKKLKELTATLDALEKRKRFRKLDFYAPYDKQKEFHTMGATKRERLLMAGNQQGKTYSGAAEMAYHLTGQYPADWAGRKFEHPIKAWACGESSTLVRDQPQSLLCGTPGVEEDRGTGLIPKEDLKDWSLARGVTDAYDTIQVQHYTDGVPDGISTLTFKSYEQGRQKFQSAKLDVVWLDEEPDEDIYQESLARITATGGILYMTFTPLKGRSNVVIRYMDEPTEDRGTVHMTIDDAKHISKADRDKIVAGYLPHQREARAMGVPLLGSGVVFDALEENVKENRLDQVPSYFYKLWGIDFGIGHPFAAALILWDKDTDIIHVHHAFKTSDAMPLIHAAMMKPIGADVPVAWPQDGTSREKSSGAPLSASYKMEGLKMLHAHATHPEGGNSTEAGIEEMRLREATGRLKYAAHLSDLFEERRFYHRKDGMLVKLKDDILSAVRVAIMMKRFAKQVTLGGKRTQRGQQQLLAQNVDFDVF